MRLDPTGERMVVDQYQSSVEEHVIYLMHVAAYGFAEQFAHGKRVLDYGCGSGYGAARLAEKAREVNAVDVSLEAITYARIHFSRPNLTFARISTTGRLPFPDGVFDTIVSLQVLEHINDTAHYLSEVRRLLAPGGCLVLVTPNRANRLLPMQRPWNRWHVYEYSERTLRKTLIQYFVNVQVQHMSGQPEVIRAELRRWHKLKWLTLPATLPIIPDSLRIIMLNGLHALRRVRMKPRGRRGFTFDESSIAIGEELRPSMNLVAVAST